MVGVDGMDDCLDKLLSKRRLFAFGGADSTSPLDYVHPYRKGDLRKILDNVPDAVETIIVYGSSLGDFLRDDSDLDIAVVSADQRCYNHEFVAGLGLEAVLDAHVFDSMEDLVRQADGYFPTPRDIVYEGLLIYYKGKEVSVE
jgi:predicted nucleotidyltransferase